MTLRFFLFTRLNLVSLNVIFQRSLHSPAASCRLQSERQLRVWDYNLTKTQQQQQCGSVAGRQAA